MEDRFFTISEARSLLPKVRGLTEEMVRLARQLHALHPQIRGLAERGVENTGRSSREKKTFTFEDIAGDGTKSLSPTGCWPRLPERSS